MNGLQERMLCLNNIALHGVLLNGLQESMTCLNNIALHGVGCLQESMLCLNNIALQSSVEWIARKSDVLE